MKSNRGESGDTEIGIIYTKRNGKNKRTQNRVAQIRYHVERLGAEAYKIERTSAHPRTDPALPQHHLVAQLFVAS